MVQQIRPMICGTQAHAELDNIDETNAICISHNVLGFGYIEEICDIIYVQATNFDRSKTNIVAMQIEKINSELKQKNRNSLLIGPGRWGSSDPWLGIPVKWNQISSVKCFIETPFPDMDVNQSQGTHFFQNITSLGLGYFTQTRAPADFLDSSYLENHKNKTDYGLVSHIRLKKPLEILINSKKKKGVIRPNQ